MTLDFSESCSTRALICKELTPIRYQVTPLARDTCRQASVEIYLHRAGCICGAHCIYSSSTGNLYSELWREEAPPQGKYFSLTKIICHIINFRLDFASIAVSV